MAKSKAQAQREWRERNPTYNRDYERKRRAENPEHLNAINRAWYRRLRTAIYGMYGSVCALCGEDELLVLTLDHINGGGSYHFRSKGWHKVYKEALAANDSGQYRILCANCQIRAYRNGV